MDLSLNCMIVDASSVRFRLRISNPLSGDVGLRIQDGAVAAEILDCYAGSRENS